ncbi:effector-binding domain-containing protein [Planomicrobium soli]|uniref:Effector-binding domain-containing protein n=1 Tax=Planomicrobium soli TaxID=1176648 RepID=A0A2P8GCU1_9BACL|nr:GyrI-like domain-containing protein [Planomicrobium soli]PSL31695.1 effector-binding domain-containing protein [Planomicrobium soli]
MAIRFINEPTVENLPELPYVGIAIQTTLLRWEKMNELIEELSVWLAQKELEPAGPMFFRYWVIGNEEEASQVEVGVPVERMVIGDDRVISSFIPGGSYVTALHQGHPNYLAKSSNELEIWAKKEGIELDRKWEGEIEIWNGRFESYLTDPAAEPDPNKWEIRISYLILRDDAA